MKRSPALKLRPRKPKLGFGLIRHRWRHGNIGKRLENEYKNTKPLIMKQYIILLLKTPFFVINCIAVIVLSLGSYYTWALYNMPTYHGLMPEQPRGILLFFSVT